MTRHRRRPPPKPRVSSSVLEHLTPHAAGIECGSAEHVVAVPADRDPTPVRSFATCTGDLERLADWLPACRVTPIARDATGVSWIPLFDILEARGFSVALVNARHVTPVQGRKRDVSDGEWLRDLHILGLLRGRVRPADDIVALRAYVRPRGTLIDRTGAIIQRMQQALVQMHVQVPLVVSDITGVTGLRILRAIVAGQRDPHDLAQHRDDRCHASEAEIVAALTGHDRPEHVFVLEQTLERFDGSQRQLATCDAAIEVHLQRLAARVTAPTTARPPPRRRQTPRDHEPRCDLRTPLPHLTGVDLSPIDGLGPYKARRLLSDIGTDMTRWATDTHVTSWVTLAPQNRISGGRLLSSRTQPSANRAAAILRRAAMNLGRTQTALGAFSRRVAFRVGKATAITATARTLAILVSRTLKDGLLYADPGADASDAQHRTHVVRRRRHRAAHLGVDLVNRATGELVEGTVS